MPNRFFPARAGRHLPWLVLAILPSADAATRVWPSAVCTGTLQACMDGAADGDRIEIAGLAPIEEDISLANRSLTLTSLPGLRARFAGGRSVTATIGNGVSATVTVSRIDFTDGAVDLRKNGTGITGFTVEDVGVERTPSGSTGRIAVTATSGATVNATVTGNRVRGLPGSLNEGLLHLEAGGATLNAVVAWNTLARNADPTAQGAGLFVDAHAIGSQPATSSVRAYGNTASGAFGRAAFFFSEGLFSSNASTLEVVAANNVATGTAQGSSTGVGLTVGQGTIQAQVFNNTITGAQHGISALGWDSGNPAARISGSVRNNLIQAVTRGLVFTAALTPGLDNDYNLVEAPANQATLGPNTVPGPAQLVARHAPRLRPGSPAIDAADGPALANLIIDAGLPVLDADGLRRVKGPRADIGAYEAGDGAMRHTATIGSVSANWTVVRHPLAAPFTAELQATRVYNYGGRTVMPFGLFYTAGTWAIYNESVAPLLPGLIWNVWAPASGAGRFIHAATAANTTTWRTQIDNAAANGQAARILIVTHNWTSSPVYNDHPIGVYYSGTGSAGRWHVANLDQAILPAGSAFNIYAQPPSPNAFRVAATPGRNLVLLDHPLLNGTPCAAAQVTRVVSPASPGPMGGFDLDYGLVDGRWGIYSPTAWPADTAFNVLVDPAQVFACTDRIFATDFD